MVALETVYLVLVTLFAVGFLLYAIKTLPALVRDRYERGKRSVPDRDEK